jgi:hypothetical protein
MIFWRKMMTLRRNPAAVSKDTENKDPSSPFVEPLGNPEFMQPSKLETDIN